MIILGFESSAKIASVAVTDNDRVLASYCVDNGLTQSELLLPMAESILKNLGLSFSDVDLFCTAAGPGSFTGVRIGVSIVKGLAFGRDVNVIGVSAIEALAENLSGLCGLIVPCMDARRGQVYTAVFRSDGKSLTRLSEDEAISIEELEGRLCEYRDENIYIVGDAYRLVKEKVSKVSLRSTPEYLIGENASSVCRVAYEKYKNGERTRDLDISPTYLRLPQAERERLEREKGKAQ